MRTAVILTGLVLSRGRRDRLRRGRSGGAGRQAPSVNLAERQAQLDQDPYDLRCADLADKVASAGHDPKGAVRAGRRRQDPRAQPAARVAEHLLRHHRGLQGQAGVVQARPARPSPGCGAASSSPTSDRPDRPFSG